MKNNYTSIDGLKVLDYLGLSKNLTENEKEIFKNEWNESFSIHKDLILTTASLYTERFPILRCKNYDDFEKISKEREFDFNELLIKTNLSDFIGRADVLEEILKRGN